MATRTTQQITTWVVACLVVAAVGISAYRVLRLYGGLVTADPVTYLAFGKNLFDGSWFLGGHLGACLEAFAPRGALREGPIWNTHMLPSGQAVYTVAVGYPAFHALLLHLGGVWLSLHANIALLCLALTLLTLCVWEGTGRDLRAFALGATAAVIFVLAQTRAFANFAYPWREPLYYVFVLGGVWCMLRFERTRSIWALAGSGLLLGLACSVKEACIVYAGVVGLYFLYLVAFHERRKWFVYLSIVCVAGGVGLSPLLVQNLVCTGNPFTSLQFMRAAPHYAASLTIDEAEAGLRLKNLRYVVFWYYNVYKHEAMFQWPYLWLAAAGLGPALRRPAGRLLVLVAIGHVLLYLQWARVDFRHMYFAHVGFAFLVASGVFFLIDLAGRWIPDRRRWILRWIYPWPALGLALGSSAYQALGPEQKPPFNYQRAAALVGALRAHIPDDAVVLSNRKLRDLLIAHQVAQVIRLEDLRWFHPNGDHAAVLDCLLGRGAPVYFLDNVDQDPINIARQNFLRSDLRRIADSHDLAAVEQLEVSHYEAEFLVGGDILTLYRVEPRRLKRVVRTLEAPADGAAFLQLYPRDFGDRLDVRLNDAPMRPEKTGDPLVPCAERVVRSPAKLQIEAGGERLPAFREARLIGWKEDIRLPCGMEALPDDGSLFPGPDRGAVLANSRSFDSPFRLRVPVRETADQFTIVGLGLATKLRGSNEVLRVSSGGFDPVTAAIAGDAAWVAIPRIAGGARSAGYRELEVELVPSHELRLKRVLSRSAHTRLEIPRDPEAFGFLVLGVLMPDRPGDGVSAWRLMRADTVLASGEIAADPRRGRNRLVQILPDPSPLPALEVEGAGVMDVRMLPISGGLSIPDRWSLCRDGFHEREWSGSDHFAWTDGHGIIACPAEVGEDGRIYRLKLSISNGHPDAVPRTLTVRIAGAEAIVDLPLDRTAVILDLHLPGPLPRALYDLHLETDHWVPAELRNTDDQRQLGAQFFGLEWRPLEDDATGFAPADPVGVGKSLSLLDAKCGMFGNGLRVPTIRRMGFAAPAKSPRKMPAASILASHIPDPTSHIPNLISHIPHHHRYRHGAQTPSTAFRQLPRDT